MLPDITNTSNPNSEHEHEPYDWDAHINQQTDKQGSGIPSNWVIAAGCIAIGAGLLAYLGYNYLTDPHQGHTIELAGLDDTPFRRLPHFAAGSSTEGREREVPCQIKYRQPNSNNTYGMMFDCDVAPSAQAAKLDRPAARQSVTPVNGPLNPLASINVITTVTPAEPKEPAEPVEVEIDIPNRNRWLKEAGHEPVKVEKPVTSKYCSRFLERNGVCIIPRGIQ